METWIVSAVFSPQPSQRRLVTYGGAGGSYDYLLGVGPRGRAFGYPFSDGQASAGRVIRSQLRRRRLRPGFLFWGRFLHDGTVCNRIPHKGSAGFKRLRVKLAKGFALDIPDI